MSPAKKSPKASKVSKAVKAKKTPPTPATRKPNLKIDLFLDQINQEMIRTVGLQAGCDLYASWKKSCCILDFFRVRSEEEIINPPLTRGLLFRKEPEGGMMWDPKSGAVYKLSEDAYHALVDLDHGLSEVEVARRNDLSVADVRGLGRRLERIVQ